MGQEVTSSKSIENQLIRSWRSLFRIVLVILCFSVMILILGCIRPKEGVLLGYDLDKVKYLRYNCTSRSPGANLPTYTWELLLEVEKVGKGEYALTRTLTNFAVEGLELLDIPPEALEPEEAMLAAFGGLNGTFELDQEGSLSNVLFNEYSWGYEHSITGEWVTLTTSDRTTGRGYLQEIPPLPSETILIGDFWNGTFTYNKTAHLKGETMDSSIITELTGYVMCEAVRRTKRETKAGEFSVMELDISGKTTSKMYNLLPNGTVNIFTTGITSPYEGENIIDISTGIVVYSVKAYVEEEPPNQRYELVLELVEVKR